MLSQHLLCITSIMHGSSKDELALALQCWPFPLLYVATIMLCWIDTYANLTWCRVSDTIHDFNTEIEFLQKCRLLCVYIYQKINSFASFQLEGRLDPDHEGVEVPNWNTRCMCLDSQVPVSCQKDNHAHHVGAVGVCLACSGVDAATTCKNEIVICGL